MPQEGLCVGSDQCVESSVGRQARPPLRTLHTFHATRYKQEVQGSVDSGPYCASVSLHLRPRPSHGIRKESDLVRHVRPLQTLNADNTVMYLSCRLLVLGFPRIEVVNSSTSALMSSKAPQIGVGASCCSRRGVVPVREAQAYVT